MWPVSMEVRKNALQGCTQLNALVYKSHFISTRSSLASTCPQALPSQKKPGGISPPWHRTWAGQVQSSAPGKSNLLPPLTGPVGETPELHFFSVWSLRRIVASSLFFSSSRKSGLPEAGIAHHSRWLCPASFRYLSQGQQAMVLAALSRVAKLGSPRSFISSISVSFFSSLCLQKLLE